MSIKEKVLTIIRDLVGSGNDIQLESEVLNVSAVEDFDCREIVMKLEEEFGVDIPDNDAETLYTVQDIINYLKTKKKEEK